jgi:protein with PEP-CTERM/exosortase system signal
MKLSKLLTIALLCIGLSSVADARPRHRRQHHHRPAPAVATVPVPTPAPKPTPPPPPQHHTITPSVFTTNSPGVWTYNAKLTSGQVMNGDGFTIFDFGGYVGGSIFAPAGWSAQAVLTGSVLNVAPPAGYVDNPTLFNLEFTRTGGTIGPTNGLQDLGLFGATTTDSFSYLAAWTSRDHAPDGSVGADHADRIIAPSEVPDGGTTVALLGMAMAGLEGIRRLIRARKA